MSEDRSREDRKAQKEEVQERSLHSPRLGRDDMSSPVLSRDGSSSRLNQDEASRFDRMNSDSHNNSFSRTQLDGDSPKRKKGLRLVVVS